VSPDIPRIALTPPRSPETPPVKLNNLTIAPKLGFSVGVTLLGLCVAGMLRSSVDGFLAKVRAA